MGAPPPRNMSKAEPRQLSMKRQSPEHGIAARQQATPHGVVPPTARAPRPRPVGACGTSSWSRACRESRAVYGRIPSTVARQETRGKAPRARPRTPIRPAPVQPTAFLGVLFQAEPPPCQVAREELGHVRFQVRSARHPSTHVTPLARMRSTFLSAVAAPPLVDRNLWAQRARAFALDTAHAAC